MPLFFWLFVLHQEYLPAEALSSFHKYFIFAIFPFILQKKLSISACLEYVPFLKTFFAAKKHWKRSFYIIIKLQLTFKGSETTFLQPDFSIIFLYIKPLRADNDHKIILLTCSSLEFHYFYEVLFQSVHYHTIYQGVIDLKFGRD